MTPDLAPGFRYDQAAVMEAAEVIERGAGPYYNYTDDPRNIVQDVLDIFLDHGGLVAMDLGYEATIIDLRARLAKEFERGYRQGRYEWQRDGIREPYILAHRDDAETGFPVVDRFIALGGLGGQ